jgi:hypothetical protein
MTENHIKAIKKANTGNLYNKGKKRPNLAGSANNQWKGDNVGYFALHSWVRRHLGRPMECWECGFTSSNNRQFHWANISHEYKRDTEDWARLCVKCHRAYDLGKMNLTLAEMRG